MDTRHITRVSEGQRRRSAASSSIDRECQGDGDRIPWPWDCRSTRLIDNPNALGFDPRHHGIPSPCAWTENVIGVGMESHRPGSTIPSPWDSRSRGMAPQSHRHGIRDRGVWHHNPIAMGFAIEGHGTTIPWPRDCRSSAMDPESHRLGIRTPRAWDSRSIALVLRSHALRVRAWRPEGRDPILVTPQCPAVSPG
jgi:hypothetical protein